MKIDTLSLPETIESEVIQWRQLWSLAALYGSIVIGWIAYQNYQPKLLVQFQFTDFAFLLVLSQAIILVITPPIAGKLGDRFRVKKGHRLPIISSGISFAAMIFMAVAFTLLTNPGEIFKWFLPVLIIFWLIAMSIFTSPALSTIELFTPADKLPRAMAILTIVSNLIYSIEPVIVDIIDYVGAPLTFVMGGLAVFLSGYALKKNALNLFTQTGDKEADLNDDKNSSFQKSKYGYIFLLGSVLGIATTVMFNVFPEILEQKLSVIFNNVSGKLLLVGMLVLSAVLSWPISNVVNKYGMSRVFRISFGLIVLSMAAIFLVSSPWIILITVILFVTTFTSLSVSALPLAINSSHFSEKVFCVGIFFSGVAVPEGIVESFQAL